MEPDDIIVTKHAWQQFMFRWSALHGRQPECGLRELRKLMARAKPEDLGAGYVKRLMNNDLQPARYFSDNVWRFVLHETENVLFTVELVVCRKPARKDRPLGVARVSRRR